MSHDHYMIRQGSSNQSTSPHRSGAVSLLCLRIPTLCFPLGHLQFPLQVCKGVPPGLNLLLEVLHLLLEGLGSRTLQHTCTHNAMLKKVRMYVRTTHTYTHRERPWNETLD